MGRIETVSRSVGYNSHNMDHQKVQLSGAAFRLGEWVVQPALGRISRGQRIVRVRPRVMDVLLLLSARSGDVVSKRELVDEVWPGGFVADNTVTHAIQELRAALGDDAATPSYLETVHRRGYRLIPRPEMVPDGLDESVRDGARYMLVSGDVKVFLIDGENVVGRGHDVQIFLDSKKVSRHHSRILVSGDGAVIEDLQSKNGTLVNGVEISVPTPLVNGDEISIGDLDYEIRACSIEEWSTVAHCDE